MTNAEIRKTLQSANTVVDKMDKTRAKKLLNILVGTQTSPVYFLRIDIKKTAHKLISDLLKSSDVSERLSPRQMKQIYALMGDYETYPVCSICGQPIIINSETIKEQNQHPKIFTWDHLIPKSLGGPTHLKNLSPAHKICNNKKADKIIYTNHCRIQINLEFDICCSDEPKHKSNFGLRKQDSWCHKKRPQHVR